MNGIVEATISQPNNKMIKIGSKVRYTADSKNFEKYKGKTGKVYAANRKTGEIFVCINETPRIYFAAPKSNFKQVSR